MIRSLGLRFAAALFVAVFATAVATAQTTTQPAAASTSAKHKLAKSKLGKSAKPKRRAAKKGHGRNAEAGENESKPTEIASFGEWGAFLAEGKEKTCYVLAQPTARVPDKLKRDPAYVFIANRPDENIRNEVSVMMGFPMRDGSDAEADVAGTSFDLISKGSDAWIKNPAQEAEFIRAMKKSAKLVIKATSIKGHMTTDSYSLAGLSQALERIEKECR